MEKIIGELYKSGDKTFTTEEECLHYEKTKAIEDFLVSKGYEWYDGRMRKEKHNDYWHSFIIIAKMIQYRTLSTFVNHYDKAIDLKLCDVDTFKAFYDNMFIE
jgi:hypothetical protein